MKTFIISLLLTITTSFGFAQTQYEINNDAAKSYNKADAELNTTYQNILKQYKTDKEFIKNLKAAQNLWIKFRDAEIKMKYPDREYGYYGSIQPTCWSNYMEFLTKKRTKELKVWLTGAEEGDICSGSVKIK